jgi:Protein of unknown function (DUF4012)
VYRGVPRDKGPWRREIKEDIAHRRFNDPAYRDVRDRDAGLTYDAFDPHTGAIYQQGPASNKHTASSGSHAHASDKWNRDWTEWSREISAYHPSENAGRSRRGRTAYGGWPNENTTASVSVHVAPSVRHAEPVSKPRNIPGFLPEQNVTSQLMQWAQSGFRKQAQPSQKTMRLVLVFSIIGTIVLSGLGMAIWAYSDYSTLYNEAFGGLNDLNRIQVDLGLSKGSPNSDTITQEQLQAARNDILQAEQKFTDAHARLESPDLILTIAGATPGIGTKVQSALALTQIASDGGKALEQFLPALVSVAKLLKASPLADPMGPNDMTGMLNIADMQEIGTALQQAEPYLNHMVTVAKSTPPEVLAAALPSSKQAQMMDVLQYVPRIPDLLALINDFLPLAPTLLGMKGYPVSYLVTTLDSTETRPVGGFQGQYAVIGVNGGHIGKIALQDVYQYVDIDKQDGNGPLNDFKDTPSSETWWGQYGLGWGLRNSGLSPDFPTSARLALTQLHNEPLYYGSLTKPYLTTGDHIPLVDNKGSIIGFDKTESKMVGFITIQSSIIAQIMQLTGPITVGCPYNTTVTANELQNKIHYYQETYNGRSIGASASQCPGGGVASVKAFTALLTQQLIAQVKTLPAGTTLKLIDTLLNDFKSKDIQVYFADPDQRQIYGSTTYQQNYPPYQAGMNFLRKYQIANEVYTGNDDSLMFNIANIAGDKLDQYLQVKLTDTITLNADGTASHSAVIKHAFNVPTIIVPSSATDKERQDAIYNYIFNAAFQSYYTEYWRLYVHPDSKFSSGSGFLGGGNINAAYSELGFPINAGGNDIENRKVFDGFYWYMWEYPMGSNIVRFFTPSGIQDTVLNWKVRTSVINNGVYTLHLQKQSGVDTQLDITIKPPTCSANQTPMRVTLPSLTTDTTITMNVPGC